MNKLFTKIVGAALGLTMAIGVGVAVASNSEAVPAHAASYQWQKMTSTSEFVDGTTILITQSNYYLNVSATSTSQTPRLANLTLSSGLPTLTANNTECLTVSGSGDSIKLVKATNNANWLITGSSNNAARINTGTTGNYWHIESGNTTGTFRLYSNSSTRYLSRYQTTDFRSYTGTDDTSTAFKQLTIFKLVEAKTTQTITVDPASKEAYTDETISLTTNATTATWSLSSNTCSASLSANTGKNVYVSATSAGSVKVTAAATNTHTEASVTLTFSERPTTPFITPAKSSTSGYTGMDETISVTYGNLTSGLAVSSNNTSVVDASIDYDDEDGNADILLEFNGAGSTTVSLKDGSTQLATISVSVTAPNVTITGLPSTGKAFVGNTLDLGATITVTATGSMSKSVTWSSATTSVATVSSTGIVTGVKKGTSVITVTSVSKPSVSMSCTVSVEEQAVYTLVTDPSTLADGTQFVLVDYVSSTYRIAKDLNSGHIKMNTVTSVTTISGTTSGSTVSTEEADVFTLVGSSGAWEIMRGDTYLQFTGPSNGNDSFTNTSSADTKFSIVTSSTSNKLTINSNSRSGRALRYNTSTGDLRNYVNTGSQPDLYMYAIIPAQNELSSIALSGDYKTSFESDETFSFGGTVTASYTIDTDKTVTGSTTFHLDSASGTNMSGVTMTHAAHDGHTIYAKYTEGGITKTATYQISVANAPVSSLTLASSTGKVATTELFDMSEIVVTILPADAVKTYEWTVLSNTVNNDYTFEADIVQAGNTEGTITLKCTSTADSSKYQTFVLTVSGNPVVTLPNSVTLYTGKTTTVTASVEGGTSPYSYSWSITSGGSYASISSGGSSATVTLSGTAAGSVTLQCSVTDSNSKSDSASVTFSVTASAVTEVNWSASAFDVFSGATIPTNIDDTWEVNYEKNNGDADYLTFGDYELYLGSKEITSLPYTFVAEDDGESLHVEYGGISSSSVAVTVTQTINNIMADVTSETTTTFTSKAFADANNGWTSNKKEGNGFTGGQGIQVTTGTTGAGATSKSSFSNVYEIVVTYNTNKSKGEGSIDITVGSNSKVNKSVAYSGSDDGTSANFTETWTYSTKQSGTVTIVVNTTTNSIWLKAITIKTSSGSSNIANNASHKAAQRVAVKFANAFNAAMAETENCTTGLSSAWSKCSSAYNTFKSEAAALGSAEEAYAKNLIKYATAQYSDDSGEACIERMMKTYEICVQNHGQTTFMSDLVTVGRAPVSPIANVVDNSNAVAVVVIVSMISVTAIGGYFFLRKRKEN